MAVSSRQVQNKRDSNGVLTGKPGTVYDVNIKYNSFDVMSVSVVESEAFMQALEQRIAD